MTPITHDRVVPGRMYYEAAETDAALRQLMASLESMAEIVRERRALHSSLADAVPPPSDSAAQVAQLLARIKEQR